VVSSPRRPCARRGLRPEALRKRWNTLRDQRGVPWLDDLARDVSHGLRTLRRTPVFTVVAPPDAGIGNRREYGHLLDCQRRDPASARLSQTGTADVSDHGISGARVDQEPALSPGVPGVPSDQSVVCCGRAYRTMGGAYATGECNLRQAVELFAFGRYLSTPICSTRLAFGRAGRIFSEEETNRAGGLAPPLAVLSYELWQTAFGGQPILGQAVKSTVGLTTSLGSCPPASDVMDNHTAIWLPLDSLRLFVRTAASTSSMSLGRLKDGVTRQAAQDGTQRTPRNWGERTGSSGHVPTNRPSGAADHTLRIEPVQDAIVGDARRSI